MLALLIYTVFSKNRISFDDAGVTALGALYAGMGFHLMMQARAQSVWVILYALLIVWITDSGAYLIGRKLGKHKLAPHVSPNKTWEGSIGGSLVSVIVVGLYLAFSPVKFAYGLPIMLLLTVVLSVGGQIGDLIESAFKRHYGVKDSGKILPLRDQKHIQAPSHRYGCRWKNLQTILPCFKSPSTSVSPPVSWSAVTTTSVSPSLAAHS